MERSILNRLGPARAVLALAGMALAASCLLDAGGGADSRRR